jgi:5-(carboxyamino)imidazole ribonucleotide mutase
MSAAKDILEQFGVASDVQVLSAHRTPEAMIEWGKQARSNGVSVIIAGAGGSAHLPGMLASVTSLPVIGVPIALSQLDGLDSLLSIVQMPGGVPVATVSIGNSTNAALLAVRMLSISSDGLAAQLDEYSLSLADLVAEKNAALKDSLS